MYGVIFKIDCDTRILGKAGVRILGVLDSLARTLGHDIQVTCANEGHKPPDPHVSGEAFDVRTHDWSSDHREAVLHALISALADDAADVPAPTAIGLATKRFYAQLENPGQPTEHIHVQRRNYTVYA